MINFKIQKQTIIASAITLVLGLGVASAYWYSNPIVEKVEIPNNNTTVKTECNKKICIDSLDELWVEYKDEKYGFSFMYPEKILNLKGKEYESNNESWKIKKIIGLEGDMIGVEKKYSSWMQITIYTKDELEGLNINQYTQNKYKSRKELSDRGDNGYGISYSYSGLKEIEINGQNAYSYDWGLSENIFFYKPFEIEKIRTSYIDLGGYIMEIENGRDIVTNQIIDSLKFSTPNTATD